MSDYFDLWMDEGWIVILDRSMDIIILPIFYNWLTFMFHRHLQLVQGNNLAPIRYVDDENEVTGEI